MQERSQDIIIRTEHVSKLYGVNRGEAAKMMEAGATKDEVYRRTGVTAALWDVNLEIPRGKIFVIIGLSGSGKSTLVRCFNRLNKPTAGKVLFEGRNLAEMNSRELLEFRRSKISMVFQSFGLMSHRDVLGNVAYGLEVRGMPRQQREEKARDLRREQRHRLLELLKDFPVPIQGPRPVEEAIVTAGGVSVGEVNPATMESRKVRGLYFAGELLDVDAYTGGFNLQIAWATGYAAGLGAAGGREERMT